MPPTRTWGSMPCGWRPRPWGTSIAGCGTTRARWRPARGSAPPGPRGIRWGARLFAGAYLGASDPVRQRRISIAGADPYETFSNPFLRSQGAWLVRPDFHYQAPGGANLRGFRPDLGGRWAVGLNLEATPWVLRRDQGILRGLALEAFADAGIVDTTA